VGLTPGTYGASRARLLLGPREIPFETLEAELTVLESGETSAFCSGRIKAKIPGLSPGQTGVDVRLELEGVSYRLVDPVIFDVDIHVSGESSVQLMGKIEPLI
jgi:hypothetical protein